MNEIITVNANTQTVSARELHKAMEVTDRFSRWFARMTEYGFTENEDYTSVKSSTLVNNGAELELQDYEMSIDMAKHICMVQRTDKAKEVRQYLIDLEKAWNTPEQIMARALRVADETINSLKIENKFLLERNEEMKPKAQFADAVTASDDCILIREMATLLTQNGVKTGERKLYQSLRDEGYICQHSTKPTQKAMNMGLFEVSERPINVGYTTKLSQTTKVTPKGQQFFINKFLS